VDERKSWREEIERREKELERGKIEVEKDILDLFLFATGTTLSFFLSSFEL
jgi:hypothetical protein